MKKVTVVATLIIVLGASAFSQAMSMEPRTIDAIVAEIEKQQGVSSPGEVKIDKVEPALLEELGDAVMGVMIGNPAMHDRMDRMLGGDGSPRLTAFHTDLGQQYLANGGLNGVRFGGAWGMGRLGMMYGWNGPVDKGGEAIKTVEGKLDFIDGSPAIKTKETTWLIDFPDFYYYAYTDGIKKGEALKLEGYEFAASPAAAYPYLAVKKAIIKGKTYDFSDFGKGVMGGRGMMGGYGMMGGRGPRW